MDTDEENRIQPDENGEIPDIPDEPKEYVQPENDFMAGAMMANGIVFVWMQALNVFRQTVSQISSSFLADISFVIYIFAGYISSRQVTKRAKKEHLRAGLKTAGYSSIMGLLIISTMTSEPGMSLAITLAVCYFAGSILGSYMEIKARLGRLRDEASS
jgi:hypothetical protein